VLNFIYYPVSFILWCWHWVFSHLLGATDSNAPDSISGGIAWALSVVFLVFTLRAILYKPFVAQVRSMRKMQEFQPEMQKIRKKYSNDRQKQAAEMQRLQQEHGVNPIAGCLPVLVQVPVFIGLFHVLRSFGPINDQGKPINLDGSLRVENYFFDQEGVYSFNNASLFGAKLGSWVTQGSELLEKAGTSIPHMIIVMAPLMIAAGIFTHITARHSVARQIASGQGADNPQTAIMQKLMLYVFPIGVVVGAPFLPLAILLYWVSNNLWTLAQQYVVYRRIDAEETEKRDNATAARQALAPKPGQKPVRPEQRPDAEEKKPGAKPIAPRKPGTAPKPGAKPGAKPTAASGSNGSAASAESNGNGNGNGDGEGEIILNGKPLQQNKGGSRKSRKRR
jgi:YidC/Oxa1 family membrane protein insertase